MQTIEKNRKYSMKQDNELTNLLIEYGIKISALIKRTTNQAALEYLFSLFTLPERTRLNRKIQLEAIRRAEKTFSAEALERLKDSMSEFSGQLATDIDDYARDLCRKVLYRIPSLNRWLMSEIEILLTQKLSKGNQREKKTKPPAFKTRLNEIKRVFNLNENETSVLQFLYLKETVEGLETVFRNPSLKMDELNKSVNMYLGRMMFRRLSSINQAFYLGSSLYFYDNYLYDKQFLDALKNVKVDDVRKAAQKYMVVKNPLMIIVR